MRMFCLAADEIDIAWSDLAHHFERLPELVPDQVRESAKASKQQIFGLQDAEKVHAICVTEILNTGMGRVCLISGAAGTAPAPLQERLHDEIAKWAKSIGCTRMRLEGRRGWLRRLKYKQIGIVAEKAL